MSESFVKPNTRRGVLICGAYGQGNAGDDAILEAIVASLRSLDPALPITVMSRTPEQTAARHGVESIFTFNLPAFLRKMREVKLYINGGGSLIQDVTSRRSLWFYLFTLKAAKRLGCKVIMYGCGIGPVTREGGRKSVCKTLNRCVDTITLREEHSKRELESFGVTEPKIVMSSDPAMMLSPADDAAVEAAMEKLGLDPKGRYICLCLRRWGGFAEKAEHFARAADYAFEKYGLTPLFLSINHQNDGSAAETVAARMRSPYHLLREPVETAVTIGIMARSELVLSMRLHGLIFAAGQGVPLVGVSYDPKVSAFLDYIGQSLYTGFDELGEDMLEPLIDRAAELRGSREELKAHADRLRSIEYRNTQEAGELLND